jgi:hypothetical protein
MLRHTKVGKFDITIRIDEYVCPFDIPVRKGKQSWISKSDMQLHERGKTTVAEVLMM